MCVFFLLFCGLQSESDSRANTAEPRSKQKMMGEGAKGENNYQESANKKKNIILHSKYFPNSDWLKAHA